MSNFRNWYDCVQFISFVFLWTELPVRTFLPYLTHDYFMSGCFSDMIPKPNNWSIWPFVGFKLLLIHPFRSTQVLQVCRQLVVSFLHCLRPLHPLAHRIVQNCAKHVAWPHTIRKIRVECRDLWSGDKEKYCKKVTTRCWQWGILKYHLTQFQESRDVEVSNPLGIALVFTNHWGTRHSSCWKSQVCNVAFLTWDQVVW